MASIIIMSKVAIICAILGLSVALVGSDRNSAESCAKICKAALL